MKIVVVGLGEAGRTLIRMLDASEHDICVVDRDRKCVDAITDKYPVNGVVGSGASAATLLKAGADTADVFIALTHTDEINLISCMQAKALGASKCVARLLMPDLVAEEEQLKEKYNIDYFVKPRADMADEIYKNIGLPGNVKLESFMDDEIYVIDLNPIGDCPLLGKNISTIREEVCPDMMIAAAVRGKRVHTPKDKFVVKEGDNLYITVERPHLEEVLSKLGIRRSDTDSIVLVGGGITGAYLAEKLTADHRKLTILDENMDRCRELMDRFPSAQVAYAEGDITEVLEEERVEKTDVIVSLTDNDETNLVISMYAWSKKIPSVITRVDRQVHVKLLHKVNIDITVSPTELTVSRIMRFISNTANPDKDGQVGIMEFIGDIRKF